MRLLKSFQPVPFKHFHGPIPARKPCPWTSLEYARVRGVEQRQGLASTALDRLLATTAQRVRRSISVVELAAVPVRRVSTARALVARVRALEGFMRLQRVRVLHDGAAGTVYVASGNITLLEGCSRGETHSNEENATTHC